LLYLLFSKNGLKKYFCNTSAKKIFRLKPAEFEESFLILKFSQHLYLNRISNDHVEMFRYSKTCELEEMGNRMGNKKIKNALKNVRRCTFFCACFEIPVVVS
jgi:hypothetical protein